MHRVLFCFQGGSAIGMGHAVRSLRLLEYVKSRMTGDFSFLSHMLGGDVDLNFVRSKVWFKQESISELRRAPEIIVFDGVSVSDELRPLIREAELSICISPIASGNFVFDVAFNRSGIPGFFNRSMARRIISDKYLSFDLPPKSDKALRLHSQRGVTVGICLGGGCSDNRMLNSLVRLLVLQASVTRIYLANFGTFWSWSSKLQNLGWVSGLWESRLKDVDVLVCGGGVTAFEALSRGIPVIILEPGGQKKNERIYSWPFVLRYKAKEPSKLLNFLGAVERRVYKREMDLVLRQSARRSLAERIVETLKRAY